MRIALLFVIGCLLVYLGVCAAVFLFQRSMIYFPNAGAHARTEHAMTLKLDGADVVVSVRPRDDPSAVMYFGGNAENVDASLPDLAAAFPDHALYLMHYRGYGGSSGEPSEKALVSDAVALYDRVGAEHARITVVGRSLGSGVAIQVASARPVDRLVLVTPYDSLASLAGRMYPWLPVRWLLRDRYDSARLAPRISAPTTLIVAERDEIIPRWSTDALLAKFGSGIASFRIVKGAGHNTIQESAEYPILLRGN